MGFFSRLMRKSRTEKALKIQRPETFGVAPEVLESMCIVLDSPRLKEDEDAMKLADPQMLADPQILDRPIEEAPPTASSFSSRPEEPSAQTEQETLSDQHPVASKRQDAAEVAAEVECRQECGQDLSREAELENAQFCVSRATIMINSLEIDREDLVEQLREARERMRLLEEEED